MELQRKFKLRLSKYLIINRITSSYFLRTIKFLKLVTFKGKLDLKKKIEFSKYIMSDYVTSFPVFHPIKNLSQTY